MSIIQSNPYFPKKMAEMESALIEARQKAAETTKTTAVGLAFSGGGIRSATFNLGLLQALAKLNKLKNIDYLSTVSGGSYIGSFFGRLFHHNSVNTHQDIRNILLEKTTDNINNQYPNAVQWIRENGNYLGDQFQLFSIVFRNWVSVLLVMSLTFLACILPFYALLKFLDLFLLKTFADFLNIGASKESIWFIVPILLFMTGIFPYGLSYWLIESKKQGWFRLSPLWGVLVLFSFGFWIGFGAYFWESALLNSLFAESMLFGQIICVVCLCALLNILPGSWTQWRAKTAHRRQEIASIRRRSLNKKLKKSFVYFFITLFIVLIYANIDQISKLYNDNYFILGLAPFIALFSPKLISIFSGKLLNNKPNLTNLSLGLFAISIFSIYISSLFAFAYWLIGLIGLGLKLLLIIFVTWLLVFLFGRTWGFLNRSTLLPFYSNRLARTYQGASNAARAGTNHIEDMIFGDDISEFTYWHPTPNNHPTIHKGAPLHCVNMTVNETLASEQSHYNDQQGLILTRSPLGLSLGNHQHLLIDTKNNTSCSSEKIEGHACTIAETNQSFFGVNSSTYDAESLTLGQWTGISGAAFTTGVGWRTNLATSFLAGFFNIRLGYWWHSGTRQNPENNMPKFGQELRKNRRFFQKILPVQLHLLDEWFARFRGTFLSHWYLSDGGHFENTGAYALIQRRLPLIILVDVEEDPLHQFEGLANLTRLVRRDFKANINFYDPESLRELLADSVANLFTDLAGLKQQDNAGYAALARINYEDNPNQYSTLLYIKPKLFNKMPIDLVNYIALHPEFPHESTLDQYFDKAQWESYRLLGELLGEKIFAQQLHLDQALPTWSPDQMRNL